MGKKKKAKSKSKVPPRAVFDYKEPLKIEIDLDNKKEKYDESNPLILPSKKIITKKQPIHVPKIKILSKNQRKKLEKIVEKKKKKANRSCLLEALSQVQATPEELNKLTSVASIQTKGLKRHFRECEQDVNILSKTVTEPQELKINSISGSKRRKRILAAICKSSELISNDPNLVGFNNLSSDSEEDQNLNQEESDENDESQFQNGKSGEGVCEMQTENNETQNLVNKLADEEKKKQLDKKTKQDNKTSSEIQTEDIKIQNQGDEFGKCSKNNESERKENVVNSVEQKSFVKKKQKFELDEEKKELGLASIVFIERDSKIQAERLKLPILAEEQVIMEAIHENSVVIISGETGSGKTTQIPQFLYEAGYARGDKMIGITQPRRVAAISMSKRVAEEMNVSTDVVSYLIRFEGNVTEKTKVKFMTDGVLLKEIQTDFILSKYSVIILDEAHERNMYTDILIGLLSRIVPLRNKRKIPIKLIIMSATLRVEDFTENVRLFTKPPPVIKVEARQFPVTVFFNKITPDNYLKGCFIKACKIHTKLPDGGILIFVTGQREVNYLVKKLRRAFPNSKNDNKSDFEDYAKKILSNAKLQRKKTSIIDIDINLDKYAVVPPDDGEPDLLDNDELDVLNEDYEFFDNVLQGANHQPMWVLPMYSLLPSNLQAKVFAKPPKGCRLCVVSTNVAETSLTIPNIKYVVDSGKTKVKLYDKVTGATKFSITWCSKASADQRAGRAGRVGPGYCYRLYSSAVFKDEFSEYSAPEIQQKPVDDLILQMKAMNIVKVYNFPFPTSPDLMQLRSGEKRLRILGALEEPSGKDEFSSRLTKLGETMASFPVSPRFAKMLALGCQQNLLQYIICIVAALSVPEIFVTDEANKWSNLYENWAGKGNSLLLGDVIVLLRAVGGAEYAKDKLEDYCKLNGLRQKAIIEIRKLRVQLTNQININIPELNLKVDPNLKPPSDIQLKLLRQIILSGLADHVAHKIDADEIKDSYEKIKLKKAYRDSEMDETVFMHSNSVLKRCLPEWVVYQEVYETNKLYMRGITAIEPDWLPVFAPSLCNLSEPLEDPPPRYDAETGKVFCHVSGTFGKAAFPLPTMEIPFTHTIASYKWFAKFFLEGEVFPKLQKYKKCLLSSPTAMTKSWAKIHRRTEILLLALVSKQANTKSQVETIWKEDPYYLLEAFKQWVPKDAHESLTSIWPPVEDQNDIENSNKEFIS